MTLHFATPPRRAVTPLLDIDTVAARLAVSSKTVRRLIKSGALAYHEIGRSLRVSEDDLRRFLDQRRG
jgi:excisionase family DNA binding protein